MFGLGITEILILILIAFLIFGPQQFPTVMKNFIKILNEFRTAWTDVKSEFYDVQTKTNQQIYNIKEELEEEIKLIEKQEPENKSSKSPKQEKDLK